LLQQVRRQVGFVFQQFNLFPHLSVLEKRRCGSTADPKGRRPSSR
jgi:ABC-type polar amino acid transport system ATPase subunit